MLRWLPFAALSFLVGCFPVEQTSDWNARPYTLTVRQKSLSQKAFKESLDTALQSCQDKDLKARVLPTCSEDSIIILCYPP